MRELGVLQEPRQAELAPNGYTTGFVNTGQFLFASEVAFSSPPSLSHLCQLNYMMKDDEDLFVTFCIFFISMSFDLSQASLDKVNTYFPDAPVPMNRFRPKYTIFNLLKDLHLLN